MFTPFTSPPVLLLPLLCSCLLWPDSPLAGASAQETQENEPASQVAPQQAESRDLDVSEAMRPGGLVRLESSQSDGRVKGTITSMDGEQITVVDRQGQTTSVPWSSVRRLDVRVGVRHTFGMAALIGGLTGALVAAIIPNKEPCFAPGCPEDEMYPKGQAVLIGGAIGALAATWAEAASKPMAPKWAQVPLPYAPAPVPVPATSIGIGVTPRRDGVAVGVRLVF